MLKKGTKMNITCILTEDEKKVLDSWLGVDKIQAWLQHALNNKIRQRIDASVLEVTDRNPSKLTKEEKFALLKDIVLPIREERDGVDLDSVPSGGIK